MSESVDRRQVLRALAAAGVGTAVFQRALAAQVEPQREITLEMMQQAEWVAGVKYSEEDRRAALRAMQSQLRKLETLRATPVDYATPPAVAFNPTPGTLSDGIVQRGTARIVSARDRETPGSATRSWPSCP